METKRKKRKAQKCGDVNELDTSKEHFLKIAELGLLDYEKQIMREMVRICLDSIWSLQWIAKEWR